MCIKLKYIEMSYNLGYHTFTLIYSKVSIIFFYQYIRWLNFDHINDLRLN